MLKKRLFYILLVLAAITVYVFSNKQSIIREHLVDKAKVSLGTLDKRVEKVEQEFTSLNTEFTNMKNQVSAQASQAEAAKQALKSIQ